MPKSAIIRYLYLGSLIATVITLLLLKTRTPNILTLKVLVATIDALGHFETG